MSLSHRNLNLRDKIEIIKFYEENKLSLRKIAAKFQIGRTQVSTILQNKNKFLRAFKKYENPYSIKPFEENKKSSINDYQNACLPIANFDVFSSDEQMFKRHGDLLPSSIRAIFCGPSNCGKTNALLALLVHPNGLRFENVYIWSKSLNQPKYQFLKDLLEPIDEVQYFPFSDHEQVILPDEVLPNSIMIFDDIAC